MEQVYCRQSVGGEGGVKRRCGTRGRNKQNPVVKSAAGLISRDDAIFQLVAGGGNSSSDGIF